MSSEYEEIYKKVAAREDVKKAVKSITKPFGDKHPDDDSAFELQREREAEEREHHLCDQERRNMEGYLYGRI